MKDSEWDGLVERVEQQNINHFADAFRYAFYSTINTKKEKNVTMKAKEIYTVLDGLEKGKTIQVEHLCGREYKDMTAPTMELLSYGISRGHTYRVKPDETKMMMVCPEAEMCHPDKSCPHSLPHKLNDGCAMMMCNHGTTARCVPVIPTCHKCGKSCGGSSGTICGEPICMDCHVNALNRVAVKKYRAWTAEEVPMNADYRLTGTKYGRVRIIRICNSYTVANHQSISFDDLLSEYEHRIDRTTEWKRCGVEV